MAILLWTYFYLHSFFFPFSFSIFLFCESDNAFIHVVFMILLPNNSSHQCFTAFYSNGTNSKLRTHMQGKYSLQKYVLEKRSLDMTEQLKIKWKNADGSVCIDTNPVLLQLSWNSRPVDTIKDRFSLQHKHALLLLHEVGPLTEILFSMILWNLSFSRHCICLLSCETLFTCVWLTTIWILPWEWRQHIPPKRSYPHTRWSKPG
jgi:hypothetical protein